MSDVIVEFKVSIVPLKGEKVELDSEVILGTVLRELRAHFGFTYENMNDRYCDVAVFKNHFKHS